MSRRRRNGPVVCLRPGASLELLERKRCELVRRKEAFLASVKNVSFCAPELVSHRYPELVHLRVGIKIIEMLSSGQEVNTWDLSRSRVDFCGDGFDSGVLEILKNLAWPYLR